MIEQRALVLETLSGSKGQMAVLRTQQQSACDSCQLKSGCGQGTLSKLVGHKSIELTVLNKLSAKPGDIVLVSIPEAGLMTASIVMFLIPLVCMIFFALVVHGLFDNELLTMLAGAVGLILGFLNARNFSQRNENNPKYQAVMTGLALANPADAACH